MTREAGPAQEGDGEQEARTARPAVPYRRYPRRPHLGWILLTAVALVLLAMLGHLLVTSPNIRWDIVAQYFFSSEILHGLLVTLELTVISMIVGIAIGVAAAVMRLSPVSILANISWAYIWFFRGTPLLVQIIFWYNLAALIPTISLGIPFGPQFVSIHVNELVTPFVAAILGLGLNEGAYMSEIVRGGLISVDPGQTEAGLALGMTRMRLMRRVVIPQAMRAIIPPTGNQVIGMLKNSSLVSVTSIPELLYSAKLIYEVNFETIPLLIVASLWYLLVTTVLTCIQFYIERYCARGSVRSLPPTPIQRLRNMFGRFKSRIGWGS